MTQITSLALNSYRQAAQVTGGQDASLGSSTVKSFEAALADAENQAKLAVSGGADPHAMVEALANSQLAVETAVTIRDRVVEAYQEILRMPI